MSAEAQATPATPAQPQVPATPALPQVPATPRRWSVPPWLATWITPAVMVAILGILLMQFQSLHAEIQASRTENVAGMERINARIDGLYQRLPPPQPLKENQG